MSNKKVLLWDIETSPMVVATFSLYQDSIQPNAILKNSHILCVSYKWLGLKRVHHLKLTKEELLAGDDKRVVERICSVVSQADVVVAHNGDKFDLKRLKERAVYHGVTPFHFVRSVDTLKVARKHFRFASNRLDYIGQYLCNHGKMGTSKGLWLRCLEGDYAALEEMAAYCDEDVRVLEDVYKRLLPWMESHPSVAASYEDCRACGSKHTQRYGYKVTRAGNRYQKYQCQSCGHVFADTKKVRE